MIAFNYPLRPDDARFLRKQPFEHRWRYPDAGRFLKRLLLERSRYGETSSEGAFGLAAVVLNGDTNDTRLSATLRSVALQSCPWIQCVVDADERSREELLGRCRETGILPESFTATAVDGLGAPASERTFVCFVFPGDILHPSLAHAVAVRAESDGADVVVWNDISRTGRYTFQFTRRSRLERHTLRTLSPVGPSFAVRASLLADYDGDWLGEARRGQFHLLQLWLAERNSVRWTLELDFLSVRARARASCAPAYAADRSRYRNLHGLHWKDFDFRETGDETQPYRLVPSRKPDTLGVVIPFRDQPEMTAKSALSALRQSTSFPVSVILVDNRSAASSVASIGQALDMEGFDGRYTFVAYDAPFNHSAQCNIGAGAANTDVVVMLNNDAWFHDGQALEEMGAWALVPDVATVGVRIEDEDGRLISAGLRYRRHTDASYSSPMEESADAWLARCAREASGNTFAAVAVESGKLERLGWLDAVWFPNGFNDVEFCLRARKQGYTHMYLGHLAAVHLKGRSRGASDEVRHTLRLREQYPCASGWALAQLELETRRQPARFPGRRIHSLLERVPSR